MRQPLAQLAHVFEKDAGDEPMDAVVRRFWSRTTPSRGERIGPRIGEQAVVVDLALWSTTRGRPPRF
jgi:hypothetical protein